MFSITTYQMLFITCKIGSKRNCKDLMSYVPFNLQSDTPSRLVEDLSEVIEEETGIVPFTNYSLKKEPNDSGYGSLKRKSEKEVRRSPS